MRSALVTALAFLLLPVAAQATLLGDMVTITGVYGNLPPDNLGTNAITAGGATYPATPNTGTDFLVQPTRITLTNELIATPFCTLNTMPCPDAFDGFTFQFGGTPTPTIVSVKVDPASAADFLPVSLSSTATGISLNLVGDPPVLGHTLILDLSFTAVPPPPPPPGSGAGERAAVRGRAGWAWPRAAACVLGVRTGSHTWLGAPA